MKSIKKVKGLNRLFDNTNEKSIYKHYPDKIRAIICGPSGCGKTSLLISMLTDPKHRILYDNVYICSKTLDQKLYVDFKEFIDRVNESLTDKISFNELAGLEDSRPLKKQILIRWSYSTIAIQKIKTKQSIFLVEA